jgi:hypothetical protein
VAATRIHILFLSIIVPIQKEPRKCLRATTITITKITQTTKITQATKITTTIIIIAKAVQSLHLVLHRI